MNYRVQLELFDGPLDLLLHLIKKDEVDIYDIPIARITEQYLQFLGVLQEMDLDVAGEYLVMAATLMHIKSRMLLPPSESDAPEEDEDPRAGLVQQLVEYQRYREVALALGERPVLWRDVFRREPAVAERGDDDGVRLRDVSLADLVEAFRVVLERRLRERFHDIVSEEVSVAECSELILRRLAGHDRMRFDDLFEPGASRPRLVATFLALLELMRLRAVRARQEDACGEILIVAGPERLAPGDAAARREESDA